MAGRAQLVGRLAAYPAGGLAALPQDPRAMYDKLPPAVRDRFQNEWRAPGTEEPHQMFGIGCDLQGYLECWDRHLLLFQATFDTIMDWGWGDLGVIQFFITPADLAARNWDGIRCSYTCG